MNNTSNKLSNRTSVIFVWIEAIGLLLFFSGAIFLKQYNWLIIPGLVLILSGYVYKAHAEWKAGRKKEFWWQIIVFILAVTAAFIVGYLFRNS